MTITDAIAIALLMIIAANGAYQGTLRSLIGPAATLCGLAVGWLCFIATRNLLWSLILSILGPFLFSWALKRFLNPAANLKLSLIDRLGGQALSLIWGVGIVLLTTTLLAILPLDLFELGSLKKDVRRSFTLSLLKPLLIEKGILNADAPPSACLEDLCDMDVKDMQQLTDDTEIRDLMNDPRILKLINDPEAQKTLRSQNIPRIMANPVVAELAADPQFLMKIMKVYPKIQNLINAKK